MTELRGKNDSASSDGMKPRMSDGLYLIVSMADTTWRMFVPTVGLLLVGNFLDGQYGTKPWLLLCGVAVGSLIAAMLVRRQMIRGRK